MPGNLKGKCKRTGKTVNIPITFTSQQIKGNAPALLGLPALIHMGAIINTRNHTMTIEVDGDDIKSMAVIESEMAIKSGPKIKGNTVNIFVCLSDAKSYS